MHFRRHGVVHALQTLCAVSGAKMVAEAHDLVTAASNSSSRKTPMFSLAASSSSDTEGSPEKTKASPETAQAASADAAPDGSADTMSAQKLLDATFASALHSVAENTADSATSSLFVSPALLAAASMTVLARQFECAITAEAALQAFVAATSPADTVLRLFQSDTHEAFAVLRQLQQLGAELDSAWKVHGNAGAHVLQTLVGVFLAFT